MAINATINLTEEQLSAVDMVRDNQVSILTGGPGTGKSTTVREILNWAESANLSVLQCAPTGKAAKRMEEVTGCPATTIHRTLAAQMEKGEFVFGYNEMNPLFTDLLIVDESSMIPNSLMASLCRAIAPDKTRVLFVGDQGQLPSVGAGAILRDMFASGRIPHVELTQIHRNSGLIVRACHEISKGNSYTPAKVLDIETGANLRHIEAGTPEAIHEVIKKIITERMASRGFDPVWDVQAISPVNSRTILSCDGVNEVLQDELNPLQTGQPQGETKWRVNDKVIQTKNTGLDDIDGIATYIVNGDMGKIIDMCGDQKTMHVTFFDPERTVKISKKKNNLLHAYCCTCHRMQGSEAPVVIIPMHKTFGFFVNRAWLYTAISRAKVLCITVGQFRAIEQAIGRTESSERKTMLREKIIAMAA